MRAVRRLVAPLLVLALSSAATAAPPPGTVVLRDVQASVQALAGETGECPLTAPPDGCFQRDAQAEPSIAVDPANPDHAIAVFHVGRANDGGAADDGYATTFDQGRTWTNGLFPGLTQASGGTLQRVSDPRVVFGPGGVAVATAQPYNNDVAPAISAVVSMTSTDGGLTWARPVTLVQDSFSQNYPQSDAYLLNHGFDQPDLTVDMGSGPGHHRGRIYLSWVRLTLQDFTYAAYSDDNGATWQMGPSGQGFIVNQGTVPLYPRPQVLANGDLAVMGWNASGFVPPTSYGGDSAAMQTAISNQTGAYQLWIASGAGGVSGATPLLFTGPTTPTYLANNTLRGQRSAEKQPLFAVDPKSGRFYLAYTDARLRTDGANDILFTYSDDRGSTWQAPRKLNPGAGNDNVNHWCAMIAVGADGVLRVGYRQRVEAATPAPDFSNFSRQVDTIYMESRDGGQSWTGPLKVNQVLSDMRFGAFDGGQTNVGAGGVFLGDYDAMATAGGITYMVRSEPVQVSPGETPVFPPVVHHQRTWVAVLGPAPAATPPPPTVMLPNTGPSPWQGSLPVVAMLAVLGIGLRRLIRTP
jgi:hypothetical protein